MNWNLARLLMIGGLSIGIMSAGCENTEADGPVDSAGDPADVNVRDEDGDHHHDHATEDHDHDHEHAHGHDHHHDGEERSLGSAEVAGATFDVTVIGTIERDAELHVDLQQIAGPAPVAVRLWIGDESGIGSMRAKAERDDDHLHAHVEVPAELTEETALWIEVQTQDGERLRHSIPL